VNNKNVKNNDVDKCQMPNAFVYFVYFLRKINIIHCSSAFLCAQMKTKKMFLLLLLFSAHMYFSLTNTTLNFV
jgi:hypothetical protein